MARTEAVIRSIFGAVRTDIRPLVYAGGIAIELMFVRGLSMNDIYVTNDIYTDVARRLTKKSGAHPSPKTVSRRIDRLANKCRDTLVARDLVTQYLGRPLKDIHAPRDIIFYLAFYSHLGVPFFVAIDHQPSLLF